MNKMKICKSIREIEEYLIENKDIKVCLYLADRTEATWKMSTSRTYMNEINNKFVYLPLNIKKGDINTLKQIYELAETNKQIIAINHTQPHKSNMALKEYFKNIERPKNVDVVLKNKEEKLSCHNINGPSFIQWFEEEVTTLKQKTVIVFGVGGVGEPIAREIANRGPKKLYLIDICSKHKLAEELSNITDTSYFESLSKVEFDTKEVILINCAGKEGEDDTEVRKLLEKFKNIGNIFVDLRPHLDIDIVKQAIKLGWNGYTGFGMTSINNYTLLKKINEVINIEIPSFKEFKKLVKSVS